MTEDIGIQTGPSAEGRRQYRRVNIRHTNPMLYQRITLISLVSIALAVNFWTAHPTFNPFGIHKSIVACVFFVLGVGKLMFLNVVRNLPTVRVVVGVAAGIYFAWGVSNAQQWVNGKASLQLPIVFLGLSALQVFMALEPPVNPMTMTHQNVEGDE